MLREFIRNNRIIVLFIFIILLTVGIVSLRVASRRANPQYVYAKVKVGSGFWWQREVKPGVWFIAAVQKGDVERDLLGTKLAEILAVRRYPAGDGWKIFLTMKLAASRNEGLGTYDFKGETLAVGSPIELELSRAKITGTVIELSEKELVEGYVEKALVLTKKEPETWEYGAIRVGDTFFDGEEVVLEVMDKEMEGKEIRVRVKVKAQGKGKLLIFGEEEQVKVGIPFPFVTTNFFSEDYRIAEIK